MDVELNRAGGAPDAGQAGRPGEDDLLGVIADVERQLAGLKAVRAERDEQRQRLEVREAALNQKEGTLRELAERLQSAEREHDSRGKELERLEQSVRQQREKLDQDTAALNAQRQRLESESRQRDEDLRSRAQTVEQRESRLAENAAGLSRQRESLESRAAALAEQERSLRDRENELNQQRTQLEQAKSRLQTAEQAASARAAEVTQVRAELSALRAERDQAASQSGATQRQIEQLQSALSEAKAELSRSGEAQASLMSELAQRVKAADAATEDLTAARAAVESFKRQVVDRDERIQELSRKLAAATEKLREVSRNISEQADLVGQAEALEADLRGKEQELDRARTGLRQRDEQIASLEARLAGAKSGGGPDPAALERVAKLEDALREAHNELTAALGDNKRLRAKLTSKSKGSSAEIPQEVGEAVARRWERLRAVRSVLKQQGEKLRQAGEALRGRYEQAEQVLKQREELLAARNAINETKRKLERLQAKAAKSRAIAGVFYALLVLAGLGGLAWTIAGQFAPATYIARAVIAADIRGQQVPQDLVASWQQYHESALTDPAIVEVAADRMGRRGITSLANAGALAQRLKADLNQQSGAPGQIVVELRGQGASKTARELETYIAAVVSQSNATRERRPDGLNTIISENPSALGSPVEDQRPIYAAAIFAIGCGVSLLLGVVIWRRLAAAKLRFEEEETADSILDTANWNRPPEVFLKP